MRLSFQWLAEFVDLTGISPEELAQKLTSGGLAVDAIEPRNQGVSGVVVGKILTCEPHPNADRLKVCQVEIGNESPLHIVCGASNVAVGQKVPVAVPGATLPGDVKISRTKLRGVESQGMLCSAKELGLEVRLLPSHQTSGLYILPSDVTVGADVIELLQLNDVILEVDLTPNRSDCLSIRGFAYEVAALLSVPVRFPEASHVEETLSSIAFSDESSPITIRIETDHCSRYEAQVLTEVNTTASPLWMQMRLLGMGIRPIDVIVDITNYVMLEWGQPLHAFDLDKVHRQTIIVRQAHAMETLLTLDGQTRKLDEDMTLIADEDKAIGIAGVMGGQNSEISSTTTRIVIESAAFDATSTRRTGQKLGLRSEAQQRFEKGIDPVAVHGALLRAAQLLESLCGAKRIGDVVSVHTPKAHRLLSTVIDFSPMRCNAYLGTQIPVEDMSNIFLQLGFVVQKSDVHSWKILVPTRRPDLQIEADLIEEVGRLFGFDKIPSTLPVGATTIGLRNVAQLLRKRTRDILIGNGMNEVFTYAFTHPSSLLPLRLPEDSVYYQMIPLLRPMSDERIALRTHVLPSLAEVARFNLSHGVQGGAIFEIARVYFAKELPLREQPREITKWVGLWFGQQDFAFGEKMRAYDFFDAKGVIEGWLDAFGWAKQVKFEKTDISWLHPGRSAKVWLEDSCIGTFGELHPETATHLEIEKAIYAEFTLDDLEPFFHERFLVEELPKYPGSRRDIALLVEKETEVSQLIQTVMNSKAAVLEQIVQNCVVFDVYTGRGIPDGQKSVALSILCQAKDRTLTDEEIEVSISNILLDLQTKHGAQLRLS